MIHINNFSTVLTGALSESGQSLPIAAGDLARVSSGSFTLTIAPALNIDTADREIITISDSVLSRGQEGTTAKPWPAGSVVYAAITASQLQAVAESLKGVIDRVGSELGMYRPTVYPYAVSAIMRNYYSLTNSSALNIITPIDGGVIIGRGAGEAYYSEPSSVVLLTSSASGINEDTNPGGVNWSLSGRPNHGNLGIYGFYQDRRKDIYFIHTLNRDSSPPVVIKNTRDGRIAQDLLPSMYDDIESKILPQDNLSDVDVSGAPEGMVFARMPSGNLFGVLTNYENDDVYVGELNPATGVYTDISGDVDTAKISSAMNFDGGRFAIRKPLDGQSQFSSLAVYSSGAYYFAAFFHNRFAAVAISKA